MKTITRNEDNISIWMFADDKALDVQSDKIIVGDPEELIIGDCNSSNVTVHENVTEPDDWFGWKYFYDGTTWTLNSDWVDPREE
jgi:hypothetical protein